MTNSEKYKTAQERAAAFDRYCDRRCRSDQSCSVAGCRKCLLDWLDIEADEENHDPIDDVIADMGKVVEMMRKKESEGETLLNVSIIFDKFLNRVIAAHNRVDGHCMARGVCNVYRALAKASGEEVAK